MNLLLAIAAGLALLAPPAGVAPPAAVAPPITQQTFVMRHLQKDAGADPELSAEGKANAAQVADLLEAQGIKAIYATRTRRAVETAQPLAKRLGLVVTPYDPANPDLLVAWAKAVPGNVLVVGHSNTVADLVQRFGGPAIPPLTEADYGVIYHINMATHATNAMHVNSAAAAEATKN